MLQLLIKIVNFTCNPSALFFRGVKRELLEVLAGICCMMGKFIFFLFKCQI